VIQALELVIRDRQSVIREGRGQPGSFRRRGGDWLPTGTQVTRVGANGSWLSTVSYSCFRLALTRSHCGNSGAKGQAWCRT